jgi:hypothetical protein
MAANPSETRWRDKGEIDLQGPDASTIPIKGVLNVLIAYNMSNRTSTGVFEILFVNSTPAANISYNAEIGFKSNLINIGGLLNKGKNLVEFRTKVFAADGPYLASSAEIRMDEGDPNEPLVHLYFSTDNPKGEPVSIFWTLIH